MTVGQGGTGSGYASNLRFRVNDRNSLVTTDEYVTADGNTPVAIRYDVDSPIDAFGRLIVSEPFTVFDSKQLYDNLPDFYDDQQVSGSGTSSTHSVNRASTTMTVSANTAGTRVRQSKQRFNYQPGKGQKYIMTFVAGLESGITYRVGGFDAYNGVFLQIQDGEPAFVIRSHVSGVTVDDVFPQSTWNVDTLDGNGRSGEVIDFTKAQIFFADYEWLGVGQVRFGFYFNGLPVIAHRDDNANTLTSVYMSTPNAPVRYEISNDGTGASSSLEHICTTVISEGGRTPLGVIRGVDRGTTLFATGNNTSIHPVLSVRLKTTHLSAVIDLLAFSLLVLSASVNFRWAVYLNPTIAGVDNASWVSVPNSAIEYDISRNNTNTLSGGVLIKSGYATNSVPVTNLDVASTLTLGATINDPGLTVVRDEFVFAVQNITAGNESYIASLSYREEL